MTQTVLIGGASISAGAGLEHGVHDKKLWISKFATQYLNASTIENISVIGDDNKNIFSNTAVKMLANNYDHVLVCWQAADRINVNFGLETYSTRVCITGPAPIVSPVNLVGGQQVSVKKLNATKDLFLRYSNLHWPIYDLVRYCSILTGIARAIGTKISFINWNQPWDDNRYFKRTNWTVPSELDEYTQQVLEVTERSDEEVKELYNIIHNQYADAGSICEDMWINLYSPLRTAQVDTISEDNPHPGYKSQDLILESIINSFTNSMEPL